MMYQRTVAALLGMAMVGLGACSSGHSSGKGCQAGQPVGNAKGTPACVDAGPAAAVVSYGCHPKGGTQRGSFFVVTYPDRWLYGKPGGTWHSSTDTNTLDRKVVKAIGC